MLIFFFNEGRQRSTSLPTTFSENGSLDIEDLTQLSFDEFGPMPTIEDVQQNRGGWDRLGLYMKGAPRKMSREKKNIPKRSLDDLMLAASNIMLTLKADQESYDIRFETQERQYNIMISNLAEEMAAAKTTLEQLGDDLEDSEMTETCEKMSDLFLTVQQQLGDLITNSQHFGKLKYEESVSQKMDILTLYSESLIRANENTPRD